MSDFPGVGEEVGGYRLVRPLGRGGMGAVYEARHEKLGRRVAIKVLSDRFASNEQYVSRFFNEAKIVNEVRHPNIVDVFDFIDSDRTKRIAYVMELLDGLPLSRLIEAQSLGVRHAVQIALQIADALKAVHARNVVHRDLKPDNVYVIRPLDALWMVPSVKILDFGIAKVESESVSHHTGTGALLGTPRYMAPEQIAGAKVTPATDVYALGEVFCEIVIGKGLFTDAAHTVLKSKLLGEIPPLEFPPKVRAKPAIKVLVEACLRSEPDERPSLDEVEIALRAIAEAQGPDEPTGEHPLLAAAETPVWGRHTEPPTLNLAPEVRSLPRTAVIAALVIATLALAAIGAFQLREGPAPVAIEIQPVPIGARSAEVKPIETSAEATPIEASAEPKEAPIEKRAEPKLEKRASKKRVRSQAKPAKVEKVEPLKRDDATEW